MKETEAQKLKRKDSQAKYFSSVLRCLPVPFFTVDLKGFVLKTNPLFDTLVGRTQQQLVGADVQDVIRLPITWIKQVKKETVTVFEHAKFGFSAAVNLLKEDDSDALIGFVVVLFKKEELSFQPNW